MSNYNYAAFVSTSCHPGGVTGAVPVFTSFQINTFVPSEPTKQVSIPLSNKVGHGGTKPDNSWKIEASKRFTVAPAYNKGPYQVIAKEDIKTAGRKI